MVVTCNSFGVSGMDGYKVELEASMYNGTREFDMVGLPDAAVRESKDRVLSALKNCGFRYPAAHMTVNLAPADIKKEGPIYDLPIAVAILILLNQIKSNISDCAFIGELSLSGEVRGINGVLPMVIKAKECGIKKIYVPKANASEGAVVDGIEVYGQHSSTERLSQSHSRTCTRKAEYTFSHGRTGLHSGFFPGKGSV